MAQVDDKFILLEVNGLLVAVDQHALHERLNLEHLEALWHGQAEPNNLPIFTAMLARKPLIRLGPVEHTDIPLRHLKAAKESVIPALLMAGV